ncbi:hypothetical protein Bca4012_071001 [Brassica carinata]|nr:unnamed protein product [Brassica napus]
MVGDFGLVKLLDHQDSHITTAVRVTVLHIPPEYLSTDQSSEKNDVFRFGILFLELKREKELLSLIKRLTIKVLCLTGLKRYIKRRNLRCL